MTDLFDLYRDMNKRMLDAQQAALKTGDAMVKAQAGMVKAQSGMLKAGKAGVDMQKALTQAAEANQASWRAFLALTGVGK